MAINNKIMDETQWSKIIEQALSWGLIVIGWQTMIHSWRSKGYIALSGRQEIKLQIQRTNRTPSFRWLPQQTKWPSTAISKTNTCQSKVHATMDRMIINSSKTATCPSATTNSSRPTPSASRSIAAIQMISIRMFRWIIICRRRGQL